MLSSPFSFSSVPADPSSFCVVVVFFALYDIECDPARLLLCCVERDKNAG